MLTSASYHLLFSAVLSPLTAMSSHVLAVQVLAERRAKRPPYVSHDTRAVKARHVQYIGIGSALALLLESWTTRFEDSIMTCGIRVVCFFYACKTLDLAVVRAKQPPTLYVGGQPAPMLTPWDRSRYTWALLTSMRYHDFDEPVEQKKRTQSESFAWTAGPIILLAILVYWLPIAELKCALLLALIHLSLESVHTLVHPRCEHKLFYRPFAACTLSDFWATHWHGAATPFLLSLAYRPVGKFTGSRAAGVLATFNLTGIWHGWAVVPISDSAWLGVQVWALFIGMGVGCLAEKWIWDDRQGGLVQRLVVWGYALMLAGWCWRSLECHCNIEWLKSDHC